MSIRFEPCKSNIKDTDDVVVKALPMSAFWPVLAQVDLEGNLDWREQARRVFYAVMNQMIEVNGKKLTPSELANEPIDFSQCFIYIIPVLKGYYITAIAQLIKHGVSLTEIKELTYSECVVLIKHLNRNSDYGDL